MNPATLRRIVENHITTLEGNEFQDFCDRLCLKLFPGDYTPVRAAGPKGDRKNDGYCPKARIFFAAHATRGETQSRQKEKITSDLEGCLANHTNVSRWVFLTNDTLAGDVETYVDEELRSSHPEVEIEIWGHKTISEKIGVSFLQSEIEEITGIAIGPTVEITSEIDYAKQLLEELRPAEARGVLVRLWSQYNDRMTDRQRFRVQANIGHSYQAEGECEDAAKYFLQAQQYEPEYEKARVLEALAYLLLGNRPKGEELSRRIIANFPRETLAHSILVRCVPKEVSFDEVEEMVDEQLLRDPEVSLALAEAAMVRDRPAAAESYAAQAHSQAEDSAVVKEALADTMMIRARVWERFAQERTATAEESNCVERACSLYTDAINALTPQGPPKRLASLRLKRSGALLAMDKTDEWEQDCTVAYELDPSNEEAVFKYAGIKERRGDLNAAISLTESLLPRRVSPIVQLRLAQLLLQRRGPGDISRGSELLRSRLGDLPQLSPEICTEYLFWLLDAERQTNGLDAALTLLTEVAEGLVGPESVLLLKAELLRVAGTLEEAIAIARQLEPLISVVAGSDITRRTALLLQALGLHHEALKIWKRIVRTDYIGADTFRAIDCARQCGDVQFILDVSSRLRTNRIWDKRLFELELSYRAQYNDTQTEIGILQDFLRDPLDISYVPQALLRLSVAGIRTGKEELIETDPAKLPAVTDVPPVIGQHVVEVLRRGPQPALAATYAYEMVRLNWDDPDAHAAMARVFFPGAPVPAIVEPTHAAPGSTVCYVEDDTGREHWYTIEDSAIGRPQSMLHEHAPDEPLSQAMLGKKTGDTFHLIKDHIQERTATIKEVMSKYKYRFNESLRELATRFSHTGFVREVVLPKGDGRFDFSVLERMAERRTQSINKMLEVYRDHLCPVYLLAVGAGRSILETMEFLVFGTDLKLQCCLGSDEEHEGALRSLDAAKIIVIDATALITLLFTESYAVLDKLSAQLVVTEGTLSDLRSTAFMHGDPQTQAGSFSTNGFVPTSPEVILKARAALQSLIGFIGQRCEIRSGSVAASVEPGLREQLLGGFGHGALESMLLASQAGSVLWTDDLATASFAKQQFGSSRIWSQFVVDRCVTGGILPQEVSDEVAMKLFGMRYYYVRPSVSIIMHAVKKCQGDVDSVPLAQVLNWFSDEKAKKDGQFMIGAGILKPLWQTSLVDDVAQRVTVRIMEGLTRRPGGSDVIRGLLHNLDAIFGLDVVNASRARQVIKAWLKGSRTRIIIP